jgi:hypothetical protein
MSEIDRLFKGRNRNLAQSILTIAGELRDYWPLTARQVYYQAVARQLIPNNQKEYRRITKILVTLRRNNLLSWAAIEDNSRRTTEKKGVSNLSTFLDRHFSAFLKPESYSRCLIQTQAIHAEVAVEKDALASIVENAIWPYCVRLSVLKGQASATMVHDMADRFSEAEMLGKRPVLIHLGDLDPSGVAIPKALVRNMRLHHGVNVELIRAGLNPDQVDSYRLPVSPDAAKRNDPNFGIWAEEYGADHPPFELDALHPEELTKLAEDTLSSLFDMGEMAEQQRQEQDDRKIIRRIRLDVQGYLTTSWPGYFNPGTSTHLGGAV